MADNLTWLREDDRLILRGELDQETVGALWEKREAAMSEVSIIDLYAIDRVDTSGLAMLLHLVQIGRQGGKHVSLAGISDKLTTLAKLYNLPADLIPVATS
ncbi:lipid asymmetry maintenance protein MlaB [Atlantibacter hermannii]|uniref:lipid asymmetry maintenance protein MlaB n=1 Tax=Atlantibacter hermannii TaxID=565 RepID=UPI000EBDC268|nr:lipid asymmetry maintenance protein MlaB [Atlantibacter hermannii]EBW6088654.1 lipid asymmetry maintenance protein MlaB [Salmonella enterica subsp. enterica serovar Enteritidis]MCQ4968849.1 lipid asymmetry maintenance protein MlaB [Enterobacteriaceae bacterium DFI.7.85]HAI49594.1 phospholipid ABC transporter substrate-binding protein [Enterobacteriaceae bacterium]MBW9429927.1 lipid asymmetry maintenance protein MlaB [Atlantibacter hermannii]MDQ7882589.1 lipid asymmetry maintenance protein M